MQKTLSVKKLAFCAVCIALAAVASILTIYKFPFGGSVTICSMLIIIIPSWLYGVRIGAACGLVYGMIQFILAPYIISVPQFILDYVLAFSVMCVAGLFREKKNGLLKGYIAAVFARWIVATCAGLAWVAAGFTAWEGWNPIPYSMAYNACYIFAEAAITVAILMVPAMKKALDYVKQQSY
ncbi:MAG: energy-coupled thiamine transporter ThiT [Eubacteriales bacterium]|nr:energy-coupled thiamine transporter ThiT [Eubacteriales bacterium]